MARPCVRCRCRPGATRSRSARRHLASPSPLASISRPAPRAAFTPTSAPRSLPCPCASSGSPPHWSPRASIFPDLQVAFTATSAARYGSCPWATSGSRPPVAATFRKRRSGELASTPSESRETCRSVDAPFEPRKRVNSDAICRVISRLRIAGVSQKSNDGVIPRLPKSFKILGINFDAFCSLQTQVARATASGRCIWRA
jgi:hypothetical protein